MEEQNVTLASLLSGAKAVCVDTAPLIYHLEREPRYFLTTKEVFGILASQAKLPIVSSVSVPEIVTKPFRHGRESFIDDFESIVLPCTMYSP
jgi:hypothetical protein